MNKALKEFAESEGYEFTWETQCLECFEDFRCEKYLPDKIIKEMIEKKSDDCVSWFISESSDDRFMYCSKCRKDMGRD